MHDHGPSRSIAGLNAFRSHDEWKLQSKKARDKSLGIDIMHDSGPLCSATGPSYPILVNTARSNYEQELQPVGSWLRKEFDLECDLELALHSGLYVISPGVHGSQSSSTWINHRTSLLPHFGTVVIFPIRHISYGLLKPLIMITRDVPRFPTDGQGSLYLARVPHLYLCPEEAIRCSICHLKKSLRSEEHTSELQSPDHLVCRLLLEKKKNN